MNTLGFRTELKFIINIKEYNILRNRLIHCINFDENTMENKIDYHVRSLYFDNQNMKAFYDKLNGKNNRIKHRVRIYNQSEIFIRLEAKIKKGEYVAKEQIEISRENYIKLIHGDFIKSTDMQKLPERIELFVNNRVNNYKPVIIVDYIREAYIYNIGNVRITFDKNLKFALNSQNIFDDDMVLQDYFKHGEIILEIKFDRFLPDFIRNLVQIESFQQIAFSKYVNCLIELNQYGKRLF